MADRKTTRSRKPRSRMLRFSEVKGKTVNAGVILDRVMPRQRGDAAERN